MFKYSLDNKRYHTLNYHLKNKYHEKISKISLNAGFTCPNIDGTVGYGGCIYCSKSGSGEFGGNVNKTITEQFYEIKEKIDKKWPSNKYIAYFQAHTNTYAPLHILKQKYEEALAIPNVIGIAIATRADSITNETMDYLEELNKRTNLTIELGLQTIHEKTSKLINRCHTLEQFEKTVRELQKRKGPLDHFHQPKDHLAHFGCFGCDCCDPGHHLVCAQKLPDFLLPGGSDSGQTPIWQTKEQFRQGRSSRFQRACPYAQSADQSSQKAL